MTDANTTPSDLSSRPSWGRELMASLVVFLVALPLCMGIAIASGVPPAMGLISGIIGGLVVGLLAGSPLQVSGPAAGLAVIVWEIVQTFGLAALGVAVVAAGLLQILAGTLKLGRWFRAVSPALIQGMLAGIGVLILASQFHVMLDTKPVGNGLENLLLFPRSIFSAISPTTGANHHLAALVGVVTIGTILAWNQWRPTKLKAVPGPLVAVVVGSALANALGMNINFVSVPEDLTSTFSLPSLQSVRNLAEPGFFVATLGLALIASAETLLCATATDRLSPHSKTNYDKELVAQGVGNTLAGILGALPITGVIVRTSANVEAGARTRWSAVAHGAWLLVVVAMFPLLLTGIPTASLAAILVYTGFKLANPKQLVKLWQTGRGEAGVFAVTVLAVVATDLLTGVLVGLACALIKLLATVAVVDVEVSEEEGNVEVALHGAATFVRLPAIATALETIAPAKTVVLHVGGLAYIDHACMELLRAWQQDYERKGGEVHVAWDDLEIRHKTDRPQLALVATAMPPPAEKQAS